MLSEAQRQAYTAILKEELLVAMGCTEPIAIAYAAAIIRKMLGAPPTRLEARLSGNIIKNVKSVIVPATGGLHGIEAAISAGLVAACPERKLEVLTALQPADRQRIAQLLVDCKFVVEEMDSIHPFDLELTGFREDDRAVVRITGNHTNVVKVLKNGQDETAAFFSNMKNSETVRTDRSVLNVKDIIDFAKETTLEELAPLLERQIAMNMAIAEEGLHNSYGACIGKVLYRDGGAALRDRARAWAAAGSDARMSGCEMPVCILSGSGNQGITASVPVVIYAKEYGKTHEELLRALVVSDLITIHLKTGIGCLSAYCGAVSAGCGCGCGISYLMGGGFYEAAHTLVNSVAVLSGTICDGAKPSCAAKIAMAVDAGILGYEMTSQGHQFYGGDGIITKGVENTIENIGRLAKDGMSQTDKEIIRIMLSSC